MTPTAIKGKPPKSADRCTAAHHEALQAFDSATWRADLRRRLINWYTRRARDLPWRRTRDPYHVWVSEIMLQQTVVATVIPYFERFLKHFPTATALANAPEQHVLRQWEGLGYYRRARQLHRAAQIVRDEHGGTFPRDSESVRRLPGIGRYTAGAILSIAFDQSEPILEANTVRLLARLLAFDRPTSTAAGQALLWGSAEQLLPRRGARTFNQALMELGSLVCVPNQPRCDECPLAMLCPTRRYDLAAQVPAPRPRPVIENVRHAAIVVRRGRRVLLVERQAGERWAGLWDFPRIELDTADDRTIERHIVACVADETGCRVRLGELLTTFTHSVTRFRISLDCYAAACERAGPPSNAKRRQQWVRPEELVTFPLSSPARRLAHLVSSVPSSRPKGKQSKS